MSTGTKVTHTGIHKYSIPGKRAADSLSGDERELYELTQLSGVQLSPAVFRILLDLLKHNVSPVAITQVLKSMVRTKSPNSTTFTLIPDSSRSTSGTSSLMTSRTPSGLTTSASSRKGTSMSSVGGSSVSSSARSTSSVPDSAAKRSGRIGSGSSRAGGSGRQKSAREAGGQRQPKS